MANVKVPPFLEAPQTVVGPTPQTVFPFAFPFWDDADLLVYVDGVLVASADYTVEGLAVQDGDPVEGGFGSGVVTLDSAVSNVTVTIDRQVVGDRETQFARSAPLGMPALNADLNRVVARQQDLERHKLDVPTFGRAGKFLAFDAEGNAIPASGTGEDGALRSDLAAEGGAMLAGTRDGDAVQTKLDLLGAPPALLPEKFYLTNALDAAEITDVATQAGGVDLSTKLNAMLAEADGREVHVPNDGRVRCDEQLGRVTAAGTTFTPGTKLIGGHDTILDSRVNNAALIRLATSASNRFQDDVVLENLQIKCALGGTAVNRDAISLERIVRARLYNLYLEDPHRALHVLIDENDVGGSNQIHVDRLSVKRAIAWGVDVDPIVGANDLSYLTITGSQFNQCGVDERRAITAITTGATTTIETDEPHGFTTGEYVTVYNGGLTMNSEIENWTDVITVTGPDTYTIPRSTTGNPAYSGTGATAMRQEPLSGSIRSKAQMAMFGPQTWITESRNVGILVPYGGGGVGAYKTTIEQFTVENCPGVPILVNSADGVTIERNDLRFNEALGGPSLATIRLDATRAGVKGVRIRDNTIIGFNPSGTNSLHIAHSGQQSGASGLDDVIIENEIYKDYSATNHTRYGAGIFTAQKVTVIEDGRSLYEMGPKIATTLSSANPTYTPDIRRGRKHVLVLGAGTTGTVTIDTPPNYGASNATRDGQDWELVIINTSGGTLNLAYSIPTSGAPTTIANGVTKIGRWSFYAETAWVQSAAWF